MAIENVRRVLLHGSSEARSISRCDLRGALTAGFGAELHVVYTVGEPLSSGWTAEMTPDRLPELHQAIEDEARERLARVLPEDAQSLITIAIRTAGDVVQGVDAAARALLDRGRCSVLPLR